MAYLKDYMTGRSVLTIESGYIRDYMTCRTQYRIESDRVVGLLPYSADS